MLRLIKKFSVMYVFYLGLYMVLLFPLLNYDRVKGPDTGDPSYIFYQGIFLIWVVLGALWAHENLEHKTNSYRFLRILPVGWRKILGAKFTLVFASTLVFIGYQCVMVLILTGDPSLAAATWKYNAVIGSLCLILAGLAYLGISRFGFVLFGKLLLAAWILLFLSPILLREFILRPLGITIDDVLRSVIALNWGAAGLISVALFWSLLPLAARMNKHREA